MEHTGWMGMTKEMGKIWKDNKKDWEREYVGIIHIPFCKSVPLEATRQKILQRQGMEFLALSRFRAMMQIEFYVFFCFGRESW